MKPLFKYERRRRRLKDIRFRVVVTRIFHPIHSPSPEVIRSLATVAVVARLGATGPAVPPPGWRWIAVEGPGIEVSSTHVRHWLAEGRPLGSVLSRPVAAEIARRGLYR